MSFVSTLKKTRDHIRAQRSDPWHVRLEAARGKVGDDGVERISTHTLFDILEVPLRSSNSRRRPTTGETDARAGLDSNKSTRAHTRRL